MKLYRVASPDEMEREYARRLQRCTLHNHIVPIGAVILFAILLWGSFQGPTGSDTTDTEYFGPDIYSI